MPYTIQTNLDPISLADTASVRFMNRMDRKYWFHVRELPALFAAMKDHYDVLVINGKEWQDYISAYYDTSDDRFYRMHHNGQANRYKIRRRDYLSSDEHFMELKFKTNKGRTIKKRIETGNALPKIDAKENDFITARSGIEGTSLHGSLITEFTRLTLVRKDRSERCTVDIQVRYRNGERQASLDDIAILEIKSEKGRHDSPLVLYLRDHRLKPGGFSKYCIGRSLTEDGIKKNRFKPVIREIVKFKTLNR